MERKNENDHDFKRILLLFTASAFAELSVEDFEKIRTLLREEISAVETRLTEKMTATETHLKGYITQEIEKVNVKIGEMDPVNW